MNLFDLAVKIGVDDQASEAIGRITESLGNGLATAAKIGTAAVASAVAGIGALTKSAVDGYADYEQLVGGVETLFKESAITVQKYADNAYKSAGLSANEYMTTVTSFSASLLQSLGNDTIMAAEYADMAITDMADNANKMGTGIEMIQNAYQGFAKQNYTMLDNLKLGYGGTQAEMKRLIEDAAKLSDTVDAQSMSFDNIVKAIHVVQTEMGITGTTAKEAGETISGSAASMKAAWGNLAVAMASDTADFDKAFEDMLESTGTFAENLMPRIGTALGGVAKLFEASAEKLPEFVDTAIDKIGEKLPDLMSTGGKIVSAVGDAIITNAPKVINTGASILTNFANGITENLENGSLLDATKSIIDSAVDFLSDENGNLKMLAFAGGAMVVELGEYIAAASGEIAEGAKAVADSFVAWFQSEEGQKILSLASQAVELKMSADMSQMYYKFGEIGASIAGWISGGLQDFDWTETLESIKKLFSDAVRGWIRDVANPFFEGFTGGEQNFEDYISGIFPGYEPQGQPIIEKGTGFQDVVDIVLTGSNYVGGGVAGATAGVTVVQNIYSQAQTAADLMMEAQYEQELAMLTQVP